MLERFDKLLCINSNECVYCSGDNIVKNGMGGPCSTYEVEERCIQGFGGET